MRAARLMNATSPYSDVAVGADLPPVVILNPASNGGRAAKLRRMIERALRGRRGELVLTTAPRHATRLAAEAARAGRSVVVVGGDGAIHEAACGILESGIDVPIGVVPAGNGNDYAIHVARMPRNIAQALELALSGPIERVDAGKFNGEFFVNALGIGLDANVAVTAERYKKYGLAGHPLYLTASLSELLFRFDGCPTLTIRLDDTEPTRQTFALVALSIGPRYGGGFLVNPAADPQDGMFDVCLVVKPSVLRAINLVHKLESGKHIGEPETTIVRCRHIVLEADHPINAQADGEISQAARFDVSLLPGALALRRGPAVR
jgi:YegS/Rv2252/BmrU family lipid kinase